MAVIDGDGKPVSKGPGGWTGPKVGTKDELGSGVFKGGAHESEMGTSRSSWSHRKRKKKPIPETPSAPAPAPAPSIAPPAPTARLTPLEPGRTLNNAELINRAAQMRASGVSEKDIQTETTSLLASGGVVSGGVRHYGSTGKLVPDKEATPTTPISKFRQSLSPDEERLLGEVMDYDILDEEAYKKSGLSEQVYGLERRGKLLDDRATAIEKKKSELTAEGTALEADLTEKRAAVDIYNKSKTEFEKDVALYNDAVEKGKIGPAQQQSRYDELVERQTGLESAYGYLNTANPAIDTFNARALTFDEDVSAYLSQETSFMEDALNAAKGREKLVKMGVLAPRGLTEARAEIALEDAAKKPLSESIKERYARIYAASTSGQNVNPDEGFANKLGNVYYKLTGTLQKGQDDLIGTGGVARIMTNPFTGGIKPLEISVAMKAGEEELWSRASNPFVSNLGRTGYAMGGTLVGMARPETIATYFGALKVAGWVGGKTLNVGERLAYAESAAESAKIASAGIRAARTLSIAQGVGGTAVAGYGLATDRPALVGAGALFAISALKPLPVKTMVDTTIAGAPVKFTSLSTAGRVAGTSASTRIYNARTAIPSTTGANALRMAFGGAGLGLVTSGFVRGRPEEVGEGLAYLTPLAIEQAASGISRAVVSHKATRNNAAERDFIDLGTETQRARVVDPKRGTYTFKRVDGTPATVSEGLNPARYKTQIAREIDLAPSKYASIIKNAPGAYKTLAARAAMNVRVGGRGPIAKDGRVFLERLARSATAAVPVAETNIMAGYSKVRGTDAYAVKGWKPARFGGKTVRATIVSKTKGSPGTMSAKETAVLAKYTGTKSLTTTKAASARGTRAPAITGNVVVPPAGRIPKETFMITGRKSTTGGRKLIEDDSLRGNREIGYREKRARELTYDEKGRKLIEFEKKRPAEITGPKVKDITRIEARPSTPYRITNNVIVSPVPAPIPAPVPPPASIPPSLPPNPPLGALGGGIGGIGGGTTSKNRRAGGMTSFVGHRVKQYWFSKQKALAFVSLRGATKTMNLIPARNGTPTIRTTKGLNTLSTGLGIIKRKTYRTPGRSPGARVRRLVGTTSLQGRLARAL